MITTRLPLRLARAAVRLAARSLPTPKARARYEAEFLAELHGLDAWRQIRHTAGVLLRIVALRAALGSAARVEENVVTTMLIRPGDRTPFWRCRMIRLHDFEVCWTEDGGRYQRCARCGEDSGRGGFATMATAVPYPGEH